MTSTLGIKKIQYPNGTNIATLDSSGSIAFAGALTANAGVVVDNITINGTEIDLSSGDLTLDVAGDIILDAGGAEIKLSDDGTQFANLYTSSSNFYIQSSIQDKDIIFQGNDGGSGITALTLDMSAAGQANFNSNIFTGNTAEFVDGTGTGDKGVQINPIGMVVSTRNGGISGIFGRQASDGDIIQLRKSGSAVGSIGVTSGDQIYIGRNTSSQGIKLKNSALLPSSNAGADADNSKDLGSSSARWKDLYLSSGVRVGGTGTANLLSDYEEGTWTPTMGGNTTYYARNGVYTKIGNKVFVRGQISINQIGTGNTANISGLPFAAETTPNGNPAGTLAVNYYSGLAIAVIHIAGYVPQATTVIYTVANVVASSTVQYNTGNFYGNGSRLDFSMTYRV